MTYILLLVLLLTPAWGWAEDLLMPKGYDCFIWDDQREGLRMEGRDCPGGSKSLDVTIDLTCYRRMREAIKAMRLYTPSVDRYGNIVAHDQSYLDRNKREVIVAMRLLDQTMKDCVEGK